MVLEPLEPVNYISYDECIDITEEDLGDKIYNKTGLHPSRAFYKVLKESLNYTDEEIYRDVIYTVKKKFRIKYTDKIIEQDVTLMKPEGLLVDYNLLPVEEVKKLRKNSKLRKKYPDKKYTYKLHYVHPLKYKNVLKRLGVDVDNIVYWSKFNEYLK